MRRAAALLLCAVFLASRSPSASGDTEPGLAFYEERAAIVLRPAADAAWRAAESARRLQLYGRAREMAELAITLHPDHAKARGLLGYTRRGRSWFFDASGAARLPEEDLRPENTPEAEFRDVVERWERDDLAKADAAVAAAYTRLGAECAARGFDEQARKGFEAAVRLDPTNASAQAGLGRRKVGAEWLTPEQIAARDAAGEPRAVGERSEWDESLGATLAKAQTAHFRVETPFGVEEAMGQARAAERAFSAYMIELGRDPLRDPFAERAVVVVTASDAQWRAFVDRVGSGRDVEFARTLGSWRRGRVIGIGPQDPLGAAALRRDLTVHHAVHLLDEVVHRLRKPWINEALAYRQTIGVLGTCLTHCLAQTEPGATRAGRPMSDPKPWEHVDRWKPLLRQMVHAGDDAPLRELLHKTRLDLTFTDAVKCWSVVSWLIERDAAKFAALLPRLAVAARQDVALQEHYGQGVEQLDTEWRQYVLRTY